MSTDRALANPTGRGRMVFAARGVAIHLIVATGLMLLPGGCPPTDPDDTGNPSTDVTLTVSTTGSGTVAANPQATSYAVGTDVALTATPATGWVFDRWEGDLTGNTNPATVTLDADTQVTAVFVASQQLVEWTQTTIETDTTIPAGNYFVNSSITVDNNAVLTLSPGVTLRFSTGSWLYVGPSGALKAVGTATAPIVLTGRTESPGWWIGVWFDNSNSPNNVLEYVTIKYGGSSAYGVSANLHAENTSRVAVRHCTLSDGSGLGFNFAHDPVITFDSNTVTRNATGAGQVEARGVGVLTTTSTYTGNTKDIVHVKSGHTTVDQVWQDLGAEYYLEGSLTVDANLTLMAGVTIRFPDKEWLYIGSSGALTANGTAADPILLTGQTASPGWWTGVWFEDSNSLANVLEYVTVEFGGHNTYGVQANLYVGGTSRADIRNCTLRNSGGYGLWVTNDAEPTFSQSNTTFESNALGAEAP